jgi:hypothetical protein
METNNANSTNGINLSALRLPPNYGATLGVKKLLTSVPVGKPKKSQFFRAHESEAMTFDGMLLEVKEARENYLVMHDVANVISDLVRPVRLQPIIDRQNNVSLVPIPLPDESGNRNHWHEVLAQAVEASKKQWVRISPNMQAGTYNVYEADAKLPEPEWPNHDIDELLQVAFRGKIITDVDHPVIQSSRGRI